MVNIQNISHLLKHRQGNAFFIHVGVSSEKLLVGYSA